MRHFVIFFRNVLLIIGNSLNLMRNDIMNVMNSYITNIAVIGKDTEISGDFQEIYRGIPRKSQLKYKRGLTVHHIFYNKFQQIYNRSSLLSCGILQNMTFCHTFDPI